MSLELRFEETIKKVKSLNQGILNPSNFPSYYTFEQINKMAMLSLQVAAVVKDFKGSNQMDSDAERFINSMNSIEREAHAV